MNASKEISMNSRTNISLHSWLHQVFQESFDCLPFVFKKTTQNFASIWIPLVIFCILIFNLKTSHLSPDMLEGFYKQLLLTSLQFMNNCFLIFIIPYYVFVFLRSKNNETTLNFWDFLSENMFPLVVNHIKAFFVIGFFLLLLIIPGIIKGLQLALLTQTTFFDEDYKNGKISALKASQKTTKGFLSGLLMLLLMPTFFYFIVVFILTSSLQQFMPIYLIDIIKYIITFYISCFTYILMTQAYFVSKQYNK